MQPVENAASSDPTDAALLERVAAGDLQAFEKFYDRHAGVLFGIVLALVRNPPAAEDVLQDAFIQIWDKSRLYDARQGSALAWAAALTRNKAIDHLRSAARREQTLRQAAEHPVETWTASVKGADHETALAERAAALRRVLAELPPDQRKAIELAFFHGLTQTEIAAHLNEPLGTVKARIRRGMGRMRDFLEGKL